ncbi:hypothetical protein MTR80_08220 [Alcaligenes aquatilis]|uniref:Apea-like HEPN domain-containing protein n=1 Tax=Alcaligenes aquatilis TaxID=323284 RepID=A0ABY4NNA4_9BURK|nr:hypothetical protein [Alcaligenes aquatilis]UQN37672.1 hypothetical protein MTR80_08220 [Alcaligenes aquatilis]
MHDMFRHLHLPRELACMFLAVFSRMEYALKSTNYAVGGERGVDPAWDSFANDIDYDFLALTHQHVIDARNYLLRHPPRKQILKDKQIGFVDQVIDPHQAKTQQTLLMVRTVRNNLFHGGKYSPEGKREAGRNHLLVKHAICVLLACSELNADVRSSFEH